MSCVTPHGTSILCILVLSIFFAHAAGAAESPVSIKVSTAQVQALDIKTETLARAGEAIKRRLPAWVVVPAHAVHVTSSPIAGLVMDILVESHQQHCCANALAAYRQPRTRRIAVAATASCRTVDPSRADRRAGSATF